MTDSEKTTVSTDSMGRQERTDSAFEKLVQSSRNTERYTIDMPAILPDYIGTDKSVPRHVLAICHAALDSVLVEKKGIYCHRKSTGKIDVHFDDLPSASAKVAISGIVQTIQEKIKRKAEGKEDEPELAKDDPKKGYGNEALSRIIKEGLSPNPSIEEVSFWVERLIPNIQHSQGKTPLTPDLVNMIKTSEILYSPVLNIANNILVGGFCSIKPPCPPQQYNTGETTRQHLVMFASGCMELFRLATKNEQGLVIIPLSCNDLQNEKITNLYLCMLRKLSPEMKKNLVFELIHLPRAALSPTLKATLQTLLPFCKTVMVESGLLTLGTIDPILKAHACGFDPASFNLPPDELGRLIQKFMAHYEEQKLKTFVKNIQNPAIATCAKQNGITYISGHAVVPAKPNCVSIQKFAPTPPAKA